MFRDRHDAAKRLIRELRPRSLRAPLVLGIPRGGVVLAADIARALAADLDVVLARKLRAPGHAELALGAVAEDGQVYLNVPEERLTDRLRAHLAEECDFQLAEIAERRRRYRAIRPEENVEGRSVIVTDDGIATGATMMAALHILRARGAHEVILAVPVAPPSRLDDFRDWCDDTVCLETPEDFFAIGQFYEDFAPVADESVIELLREFAPAPH